MNSNIYALLIGIDKYPSNVPQLNGCVNDILSIKDFLETSYPNQYLHIETLLDDNATHKAVIEKFENHLGKASSNDIAFVYYAGHGSTENAPEEFKAENPNGINETLVCYDSRLDDGFDLADKELAALINNVSKHTSNIIICLDACHSGSGTRESLDVSKVRHAPRFNRGDGSKRTLHDYYNGYYAKQLQIDGKITVPISKHLLLAACQPNEVAYETTDQHGLFTSTLLATLKNKNIQTLTYADLFKEVTIYVRNTQQNQHPSFEFLAGFNPHTLFLSNQVSDKTTSFAVFYENNQWKIDKGAVHGLSIFQQPPTVWIFDANTPSFEAAYKLTDGSLKNVAMQTSILSLKNVRSLDPTKVYVGIQIDNFTKVVTLFSEVAIKSFNASSEFNITNYKDVADYILTEKEGQFQVIHRVSNKIIYESTDLRVADEILSKIALWENVRILRNPNSKLTSKDVSFAIEIDSQVLDGNDVQYCLKETSDGSIETKPYSLIVENKTHTSLFFSVMFVSPLYGIMVLNSNTPIPAGMKGNLFTKRLGFFPEQIDDLESNCLFKLFVTKSPISLTPIVQGNFSFNTTILEKTPSSRFLPDDDNLDTSNEDWQIFDLKLRLVKSSQSIGRTPAIFQDKGLTIEPHSSFEANVSFTPLDTISRNVSSRQSFLTSSLVKNQLELLTLGTASRTTEQAQVIELDNIQGELSSNNPLVLKVKQQLSDESEILLPVMLNGDDLVVIGTGITNEEGEHIVQIEHLPKTEAIGTRSLGRAIKFCLMKLVFKTAPESYFSLRWVDYEQEKPMRTSENLTEKISNANQIVLFIHGIIGDTEGMLPFAEQLVKQTDKTEAAFDLVLTFDYECLNTSIEKVAEQLASALSQHGIDENTGKKITIVSHSMGGLVSRILIEKIGKANLVKKLIMAGTPNGGSVLGNIPSYISMATDVLTLGLSSAFFAPYLAWAAGLVVALKKSSKITITLDEMKRSSDLINTLYIQNDPHVPYYILAGRIDLYQPSFADSSWFEKLCTKLTLDIGNLVHKGELHDIAVYTKDIEHINQHRQPQVTLQEVGCPHIFYFDEPQSKEILYQWLEA